MTTKKAAVKKVAVLNGNDDQVLRELEKIAQQYREFLDCKERVLALMRKGISPTMRRAINKADPAWFRKMEGFPGDLIPSKFVTLTNNLYRAGIYRR